MIWYRKFYVPYRARQIRKKDKITVAFVISSLGAWKTEGLYVAMSRHPRFVPIILATKNQAEDDREIITEYCTKRGYNLEILDNEDVNLWSQYRPDLIFYQKPYGGGYVNNLNSLFCYAPYAMRNTTARWLWDCSYLHNCWQVYYENSKLCKYYSDLNERFGRNGYAAGVPFVDTLIDSLKTAYNPWKSTSNGRKKIIYAPHHSIANTAWFDTSTFLEFGEAILELAEKYSDRVQWLFKPHPLLRKKLEIVWGKDRTNRYFDKWQNSEWSQYEDGNYIGAFGHSDAMIHDCGSFTIEYMFMNKPAMYLIKNNHIADDWNKLQSDCFNLHYHGKCIQDIEDFVRNVIDGVDVLKETRTSDISNYLLPPFNQSATQNIIDCILDPEKAKKMHYRK